MSEPTREQVERLARMALDLSTLMGAAAATETAPDDTERRDKLLRSTGYHAEVAATLRALLSRAEQAEAERDRMKRDFAEHGGRYWEARCRDAETARDTAEAQRDAARAEAARMRSVAWMARDLVEKWGSMDGTYYHDKPELYADVRRIEAALAAAPEDAANG